jgi:biopolymer transport protein TolR
MAMSSGGKGGAVSDINVTPLVDVMLVLLIIFMVTQPLLQNGVNIDLPNADAPPAEQQNSGIAIVVTFEGDDKPSKILFGEVDQIDQARDITASFEETLASNLRIQKEGVYLWADSRVRYERVVQVMAAISKAGVAKMGIITDPLNAPAPAP